MKEVERRLHYVEMKKEWYAGNYEVMDEKDKIIAFMNVRLFRSGQGRRDNR